MHIKIKHNGGNKTDREKIAKSIVYAKANGIDIPDDLTLKVNLPPGSVKHAAELVGISIDSQTLELIEHEVQKQNE